MKTQVRASALALLLGMGWAGCSRQADSESLPPEIAEQREAPGQSMRGVAREEFRIAGKIESKLPIYEIRIDPDHLMAMENNPYSDEVYPATFSANGVVYDHVKMRHRGAWARSWPKKPLKVFFDKEKPFDGNRRLNLNSGWRDPAFIRETVAYHVFEKTSAPGSRSKMVRLHVNGEFHGLYVQVEQVDKEMLKRVGLKGATVFKGSSRMKQADERDLGDEELYKMHYEQETQEDYPSFGMLVKFCRELATTDDATKFFEERVDLERYVNYLVATTVIQNWDGYNKNHFMVFDGDGSKKWLVLPWDLDRSLGDHWNWSFGEARLPVELGTERMPGVTGWNRMMDRFFNEPALRARFADRMEEVLKTEFTTEKLFPLIDQLAEEIASEAAMDRRRWPAQGNDLKSAVDVLKEFIKNRREYLLGDLPRFRANHDPVMPMDTQPGAMPMMRHQRRFQ